MIDLDNNTRIVLLTLVLQQAGHTPSGFFIETTANPPQIAIMCSRCCAVLSAPAYRGEPSMNLSVDPIRVLGRAGPPSGDIPACTPMAPRVSADAVDAFVSHVAELPCAAPCEPGDPCLPCWARSLTGGATAGLEPLSLDFINAWRTLHGKDRVRSIAEHKAETAR